MSKRVLDIGNCQPDHAAISQMIQSAFDASVDHAETASDAFRQLEKHRYHLVMVNRLLDVDGSAGLDVLKQVVAHTDTPTIMITNYPEHQELAQKAGAQPGFGKTAIGDTETIELLATYLR